MTASSPLNPQLTLADGTTWHISGGDTTGCRFRQLLQKTMRLPPAGRDPSYRLHICGGLPRGAPRPDLPLILDSTSQVPNNREVIYRALPINNNIDLADQFMELGLLIASGSEARGGILLHGALVAKEGVGVLLAGPSDVGKTSACGRLPSSWQALSDDSSLVVRDAGGAYHAHPWPTWSSFLAGDHGQSWKVQKNVPLQAIFFLHQDNENFAAGVSSSLAAGMLCEIAQQCWYGLDTEYPRTDLVTLRNRRFTNICRLAGNVPCFVLHFTRDGRFWEQIEQALTQLTMQDLQA